MRDIQLVLERWGAWAANDNSQVDWPHIAAGFKGLLPMNENSRSPCSDDEGILVDKCVVHLKKYRVEEYELIVLHYIYNLSLRRIARRRHCSDGTIRKEIQTAEGFIIGCLCVCDIENIIR